MHDASVSKYKYTELLYRKIFYAFVVLTWMLGIFLLLNNGAILNILDDKS